MRFPQVQLTVVEPRFARLYTFDEPTVLVVGRSKNCQVRLAGLGIHSQVSRQHCQLDIDPPFISVSDLASTNGTYVNGERIPRQADPADTPRDGHCPHELKDGDEVRVGEVVLRVNIALADEERIVDPTDDFECSAELHDSAHVGKALFALEQRCREVQ